MIRIGENPKYFREMKGGRLQMPVMMMTVGDFKVEEEGESDLEYKTYS